METTRQTRAREASFSTREEDGQRWIEGYFAVFGAVYELWPGATESVLPTAFEGALEDDIRALCDHDARLAAPAQALWSCEPTRTDCGDASASTPTTRTP